MNRRQMLTNLPLAATGMAMQTNGLITNPKPSGTIEQYSICRQRGHVATIPGWQPYGTVFDDRIPQPIPPGPEDHYRASSFTAWQTCWFCKKQYRYVTTIEEQ
jgi:hypothetical protein